MGAGLELRSAWALRAKTGLRVGIPYAQATVAPDPAHAAVWGVFFFGHVPREASAGIALDGLTSSSAGVVAVSGSAGLTLGDATASAAGTVEVRGTTVGVLGDLGAGSAGTVDVAGVVGLSLDDLLGAGAGAVTVDAELSATMDDLVAEGIAGLGAVAVIDGALDDLLVGSAVGVAVLGGVAVSLADAYLATVAVLGTRPPVPEAVEVLFLPGMLPPGVWGAPDLKGLPWRRLRGDEWTTRETRAVILTWIRALVADDPAIRAWSVEELRSGYSSTPDPRMIIAVTDKNGARLEVGFDVPERNMSPEGIVELLTEARKTLRFTI